MEEEKKHLKRLILQSRTVLEKYQRQLAERDRATQVLTRDRDELRLRLKVAEQATKIALEKGGGSGVPTRVPVRARRRVDENVEGESNVWVLFEFEDEVAEWRHFATEEAVFDFIRRDTGEPVAIPHPSLSPEESCEVVEEARRAVEKSNEEFRRYRIRAEIARKQREAESKQALGSSIIEQQRRINGQDIEGQRQRARLQEEQINSLREEMFDKVYCVLERIRNMRPSFFTSRPATFMPCLLDIVSQNEEWRRAYERLARENEELRQKGGEAILAVQWRQR